jgi:tRNA(fMet)-specific endonuclease VapC
MPCLDTSIIVDFLKGDNLVVEKIKALKEINAEISTTCINVYELYKGAQRSGRPKDESARVDSLLDSLLIIDFDSTAARIAAKIAEDLRKSGKEISEIDSMIAAIAIKNNDTLATRDTHFKRIKELRIETW